jgi:hypothetical protein
MAWIGVPFVGFRAVFYSINFAERQLAELTEEQRRNELDVSLPQIQVPRCQVEAWNPRAINANGQYVFRVLFEGALLCLLSS